MKEDVKMKENMNVEPMGTMPQVGAMQQKQNAPNVLPIQNAPKVSPMQNAPIISPMQTAPNVLPMQYAPNEMPMQQSPMGVMPSMMNQMPMQSSPMGVMPSMMNQMPMMCCPYLMNMQCPMTYGQNVMGMNMMNNPMYPGVSPISGNMSPVLGASNKGMDPMPGMGMMPTMSQYYPMGGM